MAFDAHADNAASPDQPNPSDAPLSGPRHGPSPLVTRARFLASAAVALTAVAGVGVARAASAEDRATTPEEPQPTSTTYDQALWDRQERLAELKDWIVVQPGITTSGYIDSINDPIAGSTILLWHGPANRMQRILMDEAHRRRIPVTIQPRKYTTNDLARAANQLLAIDSGTAVFANFNLSSVAQLAIDFDGITVVGNYIHPPAEGQTAADTALAQSLTTLTGVNARIDHTQIVNY